MRILQPDSIPVTLQFIPETEYLFIYYFETAVFNRYVEDIISFSRLALPDTGDNGALVSLPQSF